MWIFSHGAVVRTFSSDSLRGEDETGKLREGKGYVSGLQTNYTPRDRRVLSEKGGCIAKGVYLDGRTEIIFFNFSMSLDLQVHHW